MNERFAVQVAILLVAMMSGGLAIRTAMAQATSDPAATQPSGAPQPPFAIQYEGHLTIRDDRTGTELETKRIKILAPAAVQALSQQQFQFIEGMQKVETVEAYTEKADGRHVAVDPADIITRDGAAGLQATYAPDLKQRTIVFPDVSVGDTLVMTNKTEILQDEFAGQFTDFDAYPRSQSLSSVTMTIEAPAALDLRVRATGKASDKVDVAGNVRRHTISVTPEAYQPEEPGAVSPIDRDPILSVSTFRSYSELGAAYGKNALPKAKVTPPIQALANDITKNVSGHHDQAVAIDAWVKKNIRYVAIFLSVGRVVPHDAEAILRNKFGDCKDKSTLMMALLAAKGIASEAALINLGNVYTLPEPPTLAALNHVILYLPEFNRFDDPTATSNDFGVLAAEAYDKPVVRVSAAGARLGRTPPMQPEDHETHLTTKLKFAADGTITGQTQETNTGVLGAGLRYAAGIVQQAGDETAAQRQLQSFNTPGSGHVDLGNFADTADPASLKSTFTLNDHFKAPAPGGLAIIPVGMPFTLRPGNFLLGQRLSGRKSPFVCFAGTQIEDIEATFDPALPLPVTPTGASIDNANFTFRSEFKQEDRTFKIHREFISRVSKQVCPPETEAEISADMANVRNDVIGAYHFAALTSAATPAPKPQQPVEVKLALATGEKRSLGFFYELKADCSSIGYSTVTLVEPPQHGKVNIEHGTGRSNFPQSNSHFACNSRDTEGTVATYEAEPGYAGNDSLTIDVVYSDKSSYRRHYAVTLTPRREAAVTPSDTQTTPPATTTPPRQTQPQPVLKPEAVVELKRVAVADQSLRLNFLYEINPDCSVIGVPTARVLEQPKSGKITIEEGTGFPNFPTTNVRSKCNESRTNGRVVTYTPNSGYTGPDTADLEFIYNDGSSLKRHYVIDVK